LISDYDHSAYHFFKLDKQDATIKLYVDHVLAAEVGIDNHQTAGEVRMLVDEEAGNCKGTILNEGK
jgi:hypothetical protein